MNEISTGTPSVVGLLEHAGKVMTLSIWFDWFDRLQNYTIKNSVKSRQMNLKSFTYNYVWFKKVSYSILLHCFSLKYISVSSFNQCGVPSGIFAANCHRQILSKKCKFFPVLGFKFDSIVSYLANLVTFCDSTILNESYVFLRQYICNLVITALSRVILILSFNKT